mgnify:CR=1 FL=1
MLEIFLSCRKSSHTNWSSFSFWHYKNSTSPTICLKISCIGIDDNTLNPWNSMMAYTNVPQWSIICNSMHRCIIIELTWLQYRRIEKTLLNLVEPSLCPNNDESSITSYEKFLEHHKQTINQRHSPIVLFLYIIF